MRGLPALLVAVLAAGCSSAPASDGEPATPPGHPTTAPAVWNPCDGLRPQRVARLFRTTFTVDAGTPGEPACRFTPTAEGEAGIDVNYQIFAGTLAELFATFGTAEATTEVTMAQVPASDDARIVIDTVDDTLLVTGFVQNGRLVQVVNVLDPAPVPADAGGHRRPRDARRPGRGTPRRQRSTDPSARSSRSAFHPASAHSSSTSERTVMPPPVPSR